MENKKTYPYMPYILAFFGAFIFPVALSCVAIVLAFINIYRDRVLLGTFQILFAVSWQTIVLAIGLALIIYNN